MLMCGCVYSNSFKLKLKSVMRIYLFLIMVVTNLPRAEIITTALPKVYLTDQGAEILRECAPPATCHVSCVTCHMSHVPCHVSQVMCHMSHFSFSFAKWWSLSVEGLLLTGPTPSNSCRWLHFIKKEPFSHLLTI